MARLKKQVKLTLAVSVVLIVAGIIGVAIKPKSEPDWVFITPYGDVKWNHDLHARLKDVACTVCHHNERQGFVAPMSCLECHKRLGNPDDTIITHHVKEVRNTRVGEEAKEGSPAMIAFHNSCMGCHKAMNKGPLGCRECHATPAQPKRQDEAKLSAEDGPEIALLNHLAREYRGMRFTHKEHVGYTDKCSDCHHHSSEVEAVPSCRACHNTPETPEGSKVLGLKDAYHKQCKDCHTEMGAGPTDCVGCHGEPIPKGPDGEPLEKEEYKGPDVSRLAHLSNIYKGVEFNHGQHVDFADKCADCHHHTSPVEKTPACRECHNKPYSVRGTKKVGLIDAYHVQCIKCHLEMSAGPTQCDGCHKEM